MRTKHSHNVFFLAGIDTSGILNSLEIVTKTFNELSLKILRTIELFLCMWRFPKHSFIFLLKFDRLDILKFTLACGVFYLRCTTRNFEKVVIMPDCWLSTSVYYVDKILKIFKMFSCRTFCSTEWWKLSADMNVCPGSKYLRVIVCIAVLFLFNSLVNIFRIITTVLF